MFKYFAAIFFTGTLISCTNKNQNNTPLVIKKDTVVHIKNAKPVFIIDAGHGGNDPGGVNDSLKLYEKTIARKVVDEILKTIDTNKIKVVQTRHGDQNTNRHLRIDSAKMYNPDFLVTVHCNFDDDTTVHGYEVSFSDSSVATASKTDTVYKLNPFKDTLIKICRQLNAEIHKTFPPLKPRGIFIRKDHIWMICAPTYPSVLVEFGFISNTKDALLISNPKEIKKLADLIVKTVYEVLKV